MPRSLRVVQMAGFGEQKPQAYDMWIYQQQLHQSGANLIQFNVVKGPKGWQGENVQPL